MILHSLTATFGKLSHQTLELKPGLNIIHAPNEWGKSTWCAFLIAMLYGIDTQQRTTKTALADKDRYKPWSLEPMSGRMELTWNGQRITIERNTSGRIPMGDFRAYETETGVSVPELTAANCGKLLLGVEREVFTRAGFIRLQDLPVTANDALRRRLNNLVTTGDESGAGELLSKQLRELKSKCRNNRGGALPELEEEKSRLTNQLYQLQQLQKQLEDLKKEQALAEKRQHLLENHAAALRFEAAKDNQQKLACAKASHEAAQQELQELEQLCAQLPTAEQAQTARQTGQLLLQKQHAQLQKQQSLPSAPAGVSVPAIFESLTPEQAVARAQQDYDAQSILEQKKKKQAAMPFVYSIFALIAIAVAIVFFKTSIAIAIAGGAVALIGVILAVYSILCAGQRRKQLEALYRQYPGIAPDSWISYAKQYEKAQAGYVAAMAQYEKDCTNFTQEQAAFEQELNAFTQGRTLQETMEYWENVVQQHQSLNAKKRAYLNTAEHLQALQNVSADAPEPAEPDTLSFSSQDTERMLEQNRFEMQKLQLRLGQCMGQSESFGQEDILKTQLDSISRRIYRLEEYNRALELALEMLERATNTLQKRFAPRISKKAQEYFCRLTDGRYQHIVLSEDLSLSATAQDENTARPSLCFSDGTVDQLYLALRLAVAGELTPDAPFVLDDALVRFDDHRAEAALSLISEIAADKQVLLFSCQNREEALLNNLKS